MTMREGNKLIACFIYQDQKYDQGSFWINVPEKEMKHWVCDRDLKYHKSWEWLMPVVDKIYTSADWKGFNIVDRIRKSFESVDIQNTWNMVIEFIEWHNSVNNKNQSGKKL